MFRSMSVRQHSDANLQEIVDGYLRRFPNGVDFDVFSQMFDVAELSKLTIDL